MPASTRPRTSPARSPLPSRGDYLQIPFNVPAGTTAIRVRYCWDEPPDGTTLDVGVYEPAAAGAVPGPAERRGWSGSAVRDLAIAGERLLAAGRLRGRPQGLRPRLHHPRLPAGPDPAGAVDGRARDRRGRRGRSVGFAVRVETTLERRLVRRPVLARVPERGCRQPEPGLVRGRRPRPRRAGARQRARSRPASTTPSSRSRPGGAGLDFVGLVDHNNDVSRGEIGRYEPDVSGQARHPRNRGDHLPRPLQLDRIERLRGLPRRAGCSRTRR